MQMCGPGFNIQGVPDNQSVSEARLVELKVCVLVFVCTSLLETRRNIFCFLIGSELGEEVRGVRYEGYWVIRLRLQEELSPGREKRRSRGRKGSRKGLNHGVLCLGAKHVRPRNLVNYERAGTQSSCVVRKNRLLSVYVVRIKCPDLHHQRSERIAMI